jgi:hypothetical protein
MPDLLPSGITVLSDRNMYQLYRAGFFHTEMANYKLNTPELKKRKSGKYRSFEFCRRSKRFRCNSTLPHPSEVENTTF